MNCARGTTARHCIRKSHVGDVQYTQYGFSAGKISPPYFLSFLLEIVGRGCKDGTTMNPDLCSVIVYMVKVYTY